MAARLVNGDVLLTTFIVVVTLEALQYLYPGRRHHNQVKRAGMPKVDGIPTMTYRPVHVPFRLKDAAVHTN